MQMGRQHQARSLWLRALGFTARRSAAYLTDWIFLFGILAPLGFLVGRLFGASQPQPGPELWHTILLNFSLPAWLYFILSDSSVDGATLGKRAFRIRVSGLDEERVSLAHALPRTAVKLLPWELAHLSAFALSDGTGQFSRVQTLGVLAANALILAYLVVVLFQGGRRSVHDLAAGTVVGASER